MKHEKKNKAYAKELRQNMTPWERRLWYCFLNRYPIRFQRQKCIDHYIVDFYCFRAKLVIELDGGGHYEPNAQRADEARSRILEQYGLKVLRICNLDIDRNFEGVCTCIDLEVKKRIAGTGMCRRTPPGPAGHPPHKCGGARRGHGGMSMEEQFITAWMAAREKAQKLGVRLRPVEREKAMQLAHRSLQGHRESEGFGILADKKHLELSLEALAVDKRFGALFSDEEANNALTRLLNAGFYR